MQAKTSFVERLSTLTSLVGISASVTACVCFFIFDFWVSSKRLDEPETVALLQRDFGVLALVLLISVLLSKVMARRLSHRIASSITTVAETTRTISESQNFSLRLPPQPDAELEVLVQSFNAMMGAIERRDTDLKAAYGLFDGFVNHSPTLAFIKNDSLRYVFANSRMRRLLKRGKNDLAGVRDSDLWPADVAERLESQDREALAGVTNTEVVTSGVLRSYRSRIQLPTDEGLRTYNILRFLLVHPDGQVYLAGSAIDETEQIKAEQALQRSEERYALAVQGASDGIWDWDLRSDELYLSSRCLEILGPAFEDDDPSGLAPLQSRIHPEDRPNWDRALERLVAGQGEQLELEFRLRSRDDSPPRWILNRATSLRNGEGERATRVAGFLSDITVRKEQEAQLRRDAFHDALTGLPNRALFNDRLQRAWERTRRSSDSLFGVLFLDLDGFKSINDTLGHHVGDLLLIEVARRLQGTMRGEDTVARLGGDEFTVLIEELHQPSDAVRVADRILAALRQPYEIQSHVLKSASSIGIALSSSKYTQADQLLADADAAMYLAKRSGKATYRIFDEDMHSTTQRRLQLEAELREAREQERFLFQFLPVYRLSDGCCVGAEALLRLQQETEVRAAQEFIGAAEDSGLLYSLAARLVPPTLAEWRSLGLHQRDWRLTFNLSLRQFQHPRIVSDFISWCEIAQVPPSCVQLEIGEYSLARDREGGRQVMQALVEAGFHLGLDDFALGNSSIETLRDFPFSYFKVSPHPGASDEEALLQGFAQLGRGLGRTSVLESVSTPSQQARAARLGFEQAQGFAWGPTVELSQLAKKE